MAQNFQASEKSLMENQISFKINVIYRMYTIDALLREIEGHKIALFLGAGASRNPLMSEEHQLPDGHEMKKSLYEHRYAKNSEKITEATFARYEQKFKEEFGITKDPVPPEIVWEHCLAKKGNELALFFPVIEKMFGRKKYIPLTYKLIALASFNKRTEN